MHKNIDHYSEDAVIWNYLYYRREVSGVPKAASSVSHLLQFLVQIFQPSQAFRKISQTPLIVIPRPSDASVVD